MKIEYKSPQDLQITVVDNEIIRGYMKRIQEGEQVDPVRVLGTRVKDGNHRAAAYKLLGLDVPTINRGISNTNSTRMKSIVWLLLFFGFSFQFDRMLR